MKYVKWIPGLVCGLLLCMGGVVADEWAYDFEAHPIGKAPPGWTPYVVGTGDPADWAIESADVAPVLPPITRDAPAISKRAVVAQRSKEAIDERFPLLVFSEEQFGDFVLSARMKIVGGQMEQIAGLVFRLQDNKNFYVARISALGKNLRFYKFVNGERSPPIGPAIDIKLDQWYFLNVECTANRIQIRIDGKEVMPSISDSTFTRGKVGFLTKSDSQAFFSDIKVTYQPLETLAERMVRETIQRYPRLLGIRIVGRTVGNAEWRVLAAREASEVGQPAHETEKLALSTNQAYFGKEGDNAILTFPLHDRNGDSVGAVRMLLKSFKGQTEANALARARPIVNHLESRLAAAKSLAE